MQRCYSKVVVLFVSALNATHVGVLRGKYFCNIPVEEYHQPRSPVTIKAATSF